MVGKIYLSKIYFTDLSEYKIRPVLVIRELDKNDVICLQLSSQIRENRIIITNKDVIDGNLLKKSVVIVPKNFTLNKITLIKYIGKISDEKFQIIYRKFCSDLNCKE